MCNPIDMENLEWVIDILEELYEEDKLSTDELVYLTISLDDWRNYE